MKLESMSKKSCNDVLHHVIEPVDGFKSYRTFGLHEAARTIVFLVYNQPSYKQSVV